MNFFADLLAAAERGETVQTVTLVGGPPGGAAVLGQAIILYADGRFSGDILDSDFTARVQVEVKYADWTGPQTLSIAYRGADYRLFWDAVGYDKWRAVILGGGHISQPLAAILALVACDVTVVDDRPDFASRERFPQAAEVVCDDFGHYLAGLSPDGDTAVIIVTRGHRHDLECLRAVIGRPAGYIGMIGSRRKVRAVYDALSEEGVDAGLLDRVHAPIGLDIGAQGPAEIALAIAAEVVAVFRGAGAGNLSRRGEADG